MLLMRIWKKVTWKAWALLCFLCRLHTLHQSLIHILTSTWRKCMRPYQIPRCIFKILEDLSTFTFRQLTWVGLTNSRSTSLCQSTIPHSTKLDLFYARNKYSKQTLGVMGCDRYLINTATRIFFFLKSNEADATDQNIYLKGLINY
jgi:hypothetical protein